MRTLTHAHEGGAFCKSRQHCRVAVYIGVDPRTVLWAGGYVLARPPAGNTGNLAPTRECDGVVIRAVRGEASWGTVCFPVWPA